MLIKNAKVFQDNHEFAIGDIVINGDRIAEHLVEDDVIIDAEGLYAIPGLTDLHFHGCVGYDFCDGTHEALEHIAHYQASNGVTTICPASMTLEEERLAEIFHAAATFESEGGAILCGINMEGPYLSEKKKGAQNARYLHKPDIEMYRRLQEKSNHLIKLVAIAPEEEDAMEFIDRLKGEVVLSVAHTNADYDTTAEAFSRGASHVTHLFNAMPLFTHRAPGVIGAAFDAPDCKVELICDGVHIHPSMVRAAFQMFGDERVVLISDSMMAAGMADGEYALGGQAVHVEGNKATLIDGTIAGSVTNLMKCMVNAVKTMGIPLETAVRCAAENPAKAIGIFDQYGSIAPGKIANIVLLDENLNIKAVILKGKEIRQN